MVRKNTTNKSNQSHVHPSVDQASVGGYVPANKTIKNNGLHAAPGASRTDESSSKKKTFYKILMIISSIICVIALVYLIVAIAGYWQGRQTYSELSQSINVDSEEIVPSSDFEEIDVDWEMLKSINPEVVAWVCIPGTTINYPIVQGEDNQFYLTHDFAGNQGMIVNPGAVFMDAGNSSELTDDVTFIYGHNMNDGSMFAPLKKFTKQEVFDEHRIVYLVTPDETYLLRSFALIHCPGTEDIVKTSFASNPDRLRYIQDKIIKSETSTTDMTDVSNIGHVVALVTCDNRADNGRYLLYCSVVDSKAHE